MFALVDCNNFFASCERLFRPELRDKPLIVLSSNDGCVIARSNESKALGIAMGEPYFKIKGLCQRHQVEVFSSNHALYSDLSQRVMRIIEQEWPHTVIYSIDEAFLDLSSMPPALHQSFCEALHKKILRSVGLPTSIGIGPTKTLAKAANVLCKKIIKIPVFNINEQRHWLSQLDVGDVWGVGRKGVKSLHLLGIYTAADLANTPLSLIRRHRSVTMVRTLMELQGTPCSGLSEPTPRKSIISSKSFGLLQTELQALSEALSGHCARAARRMRRENLVAKRLVVFVYSSRYRQDLRQYGNSMEWVLVHPSDDTRLLISMAKTCLKKIFQPGIFYKKVGVMLLELTDKAQQQRDLFQVESEEDSFKKDRLMGLLDTINNRFGKKALRIAAEGQGYQQMAQMHKLSPCYTTCWSQLARVVNGT